MYAALLLAVSLQLAPNPPQCGEAATLEVFTQDESAPLAVDINGAAMLARVPEGATVERVESDLHLRWPHAPEHARVELVLRADNAGPWLKVTAASGTSKATLDAKQIAREEPPMRAEVFLIGFAVSLLMWPTFRLFWRHTATLGVLVAIAGTIAAIWFANIWWKDFTARTDYRAGSCTIADRMVDYDGHHKTRRYYSLLFATNVEGRPRIAGDGDTSTWTETDGDAYVRLAQFETGKAYPCWWSTRDRDELLLEPRSRGVKRRTLATLAAFVLIILPGWMQPRLPRSRRRR